jgi:hypothetical protein
MVPTAVAAALPPMKSSGIHNILEDPSTSPETLRALAERELASNVRSVSTIADIAQHPNVPGGLLIEIITDTDDDYARVQAMHSPNLPANFAHDYFNDPATTRHDRHALRFNPLLDTDEMWLSTVTGPERGEMSVLRGAASRRPGSTELHAAVLTAAKKLSKSDRHAVYEALASNDDTTTETLDRLVSDFCADGSVDRGSTPAATSVVDSLLGNSRVTPQMIVDVARSEPAAMLHNGASVSRVLERDDIPAEALVMWTDHRGDEAYRNGNGGYIFRAARLYSHPNFPLEEVDFEPTPARAPLVYRALLANPSLRPEQIDGAIEMLVGASHLDQETFDSLASNRSLSRENLATLWTRSRSEECRKRLAGHANLGSAELVAAAQSKRGEIRQAAVDNPALPDELLGPMTKDSHPGVSASARRNAKERIVGRLGIHKRNKAAIKEMLDTNWWELTPDSPEVALVKTMHHDPVGRDE